MKVKKKKTTIMFKVTCPGCNKVRYWGELKDFENLACWECGTENYNLKEVEVTYHE